MSNILLTTPTKKFYLPSHKLDKLEKFTNLEAG